MAYSRTTWENSPSTATPISAALLNNMEQGIVDVDGSISSISGSVTSISGSVTSIAGSVNNNAGSVAAIAGTAGTAYNLTSTYGSVVSTQGSVAATQGSVVTLAGTVTTNTSNISSISGSVTAINSSLSSVAGTVGTVVTNISNLNSSLGSVSGTVSTLNTDSRFNPPGVILPFAGSAAPNGYLMCDGASYGTATHPALFAAIGYTFGGSATNFNLPDLRGRMPVGKGTHADVDQLNDNDGAILANRSPKHQHTVYDPGHTHTVDIRQYLAGGPAWKTYSMNTPSNTGVTGIALSATTGIKVNPGGVASDTASPQDTPSYIVVNYIIKT